MRHFLFFLLCPLIFFGQESKDKFVGKVTVEWLNDGRSMKLLNRFSYIDPNGELWDVPKKTIVDGASIPKVFWSIIGGPYEGNYRKASIIHDYYCNKKVISWEKVHLMFYNACITEGTSIIKAKLMYAAVYAGGPRWEPTSYDVITLGDDDKYAYSSTEDFKQVSEWIERENPSLDEINHMLNIIVKNDNK